MGNMINNNEVPEQPQNEVAVSSIPSSSLPAEEEDVITEPFELKEGALNESLYDYLLKLAFKKYLGVRDMVYNPQTGAILGKPWDYWIILFLSALLSIGIVIIIIVLSLKLVYCSHITKMLLHRVHQIQNEKIKLLKIINAFRAQNPNVFEFEA